MKPYYDDGRGIVIYHADCRSILPTLEAGSVDLVLTDPPYGKRYHEGGVAALSSEKWTRPADSKWEGVKIVGDGRPDTTFLPMVATTVRAGGALYLFSQWMVEPTWIDAIRQAGFFLHNRLIWVKSHWGAGDLATTYGPQHESVLFASKGRHELRGKRAGDIWIEKCPTGCFRSGRLHPAEKPVPLLSLLASKSVDCSGLIVDPFAGSGSTLLAAKQLNCQAIGIEIEERYCEIAARRLSQEVLPLEVPDPC